MTLYKASTSTFCCLLAYEQILAAPLPLALTPPASFTPKTPTPTLQPPPLLCFCVYDLTWLNKTSVLEQGCPELFPKRGGEDWLCGRDLERCPRLGSDRPTCQTWWILAKNKSKKGALDRRMNELGGAPPANRAATSRSSLRGPWWRARPRERRVSQTKHPLFHVWRGRFSEGLEQTQDEPSEWEFLCSPPPLPSATPPHAHSPTTFIAANIRAKQSSSSRLERRITAQPKQIQQLPSLWAFPSWRLSLVLITR